MDKNKIGEIIRKAEDNYKNGVTTISQYVSVSMKDTIDRIDAYLNSKHISGEFDSKSRAKPFFNICTAACNIWYRSTDIDRKDIKIKPTKSQDVIDAFLATIHIQDWMRRSMFGQFLNEWGRSLSRYGSSVVKFVEKNGELIANVVPWQRLIVDSVDFDANPVIEILELTEDQLRMREGYDKEMVEKLTEAKSSRTTMSGQQKDTKDDYIKLYEIHGKFPLSYITGNEDDEEEYVQQMHVVSFVVNKDNKYDDFSLISGREDKSPYMITHLIKEDGQTLSIGAVQHLFEAQWMMNHTAKAIKDQLDLASKLIFQTSDGTFVGQNALTAIETGDILIHQLNQPLTQLANSSHDITSLQAFGNQWKALSNEITGISESMLGNAAPSGTAWRQVETLLQQNQSLFELMTENKGLYIEEMFRTFVIPHVKKKMDTSDEISATLEQYDIDKIDSLYVKNQSIKRVNRAILDTLLKGQTVTPEEQASLMQVEQGNVKEAMNGLGNQRFFKPSEIDDKTWKDIFKDLEWEIEVDVTGESVDKNAVTTLNTMLMMIAKNPMILQDPNAKMIWNKILMQTGTVSPLEITSASSAPQPMMVQPSPMQPQTLPAPAVSR